MRKAVLADAGPLYALVDPGDSMHERAIKEQEWLETENLETAVSYATLQEAYVLVLRKLGIVQAHSFMEDLIQGAILIAPTEHDYEKAIRCVLRYPDQDISLADAITVEVGRRLSVPVWTYDYHFDIMGSLVWRM